MGKLELQTWRQLPHQRRCAQVDLHVIYLISIFRSQSQQKIQMLETELEHHKAKLVAMERQHCSQVENMFFNGNNQRCIFGVKTVLSSFLVSTAWCDTFTWTEAKKIHQPLAVEQENHYPSAEGGKQLLEKKDSLAQVKVL